MLANLERALLTNYSLGASTIVSKGGFGPPTFGVPPTGVSSVGYPDALQC